MTDSIITISREYGSGGRDIGRLLAEELCLPLFDKEIMHMAIERSGMSADFVERRGEKVPSQFLQHLQRLSSSVPAVRVPSGYTSLAMVNAASGNSPIARNDADRLFHTQSSAIREIAASGGCVIVGRCAGYILRDNPNLLSVFVRGKFDDRVRRSVQTYDHAEKNAAGDVKRIDRHRANFYKYYSDQKWGATDNYDLVINTSFSGIPGAVTVIKSMLDAKRASLLYAKVKGA